MEFISEEKRWKIIDAYTAIMTELGIEANPDSLGTPARVADALLEMTGTLGMPDDYLVPEMTTFPSRGSHPVTISKIPFTSMCAHHHLPFYGYAKIVYNPGDFILGLSKFSRVVEWFARRPQTQENLTREIGEFLKSILDPKFLSVELYEAKHTCMIARGIKEHEIETTTTYSYVGR